MNNPVTERTSYGQMALAGEFVTSQSIYDRESERVFSERWLYVGHESQLGKSGCFQIAVEGNDIFVVRTQSGQLKAYHNFCRHRGSRLVTQANCQSLGERLQCSYHAWTYDRDGNLLSAPNMEKLSLDRSEFGLKPVTCETWHGLIFVCLSPATCQNLLNSSPRQEPTPTLREFLKPLEQHAVDWSFGQLQLAHSIEYIVEANWKLVFQNYNECYHCPIVHPALNRLTPYKGATNDLGEGPILGGPMKLADNCQTMSTSGKLVGKLIPSLSPEQQRVVSYYTIFPSMFVSAHPDFVLIHRIQRLAPDRTRIVCQFLFHEESLNDNRFDPTPAVEFWDLTNRQDWEVCEMTQKGMTSPAYTPGPYSDLESVVAAFDRHYLGL